MVNHHFICLIQEFDRFGGEWMRYLLSKSGPKPVDLTTVVPVESNPMGPAAVIVVNKTVPYFNYLLKYERAGIPFGVIHLADENLDDDYRYMTFKMCKFVIRTYYHPFLESKVGSSPYVLTVGLGWKDGRCKKHKCDNKSWRYDWSFAGDPNKSDRLEMLNVFQRVWPEASSRVHLTSPGFDALDGLKVNTYFNIMCNSKIVACPTGWKNLDTFRLYEALEAGAVPMVLARSGWQQHDKSMPTYWHHIFFPNKDRKCQAYYSNELPFFVGETWEEVVSKAKHLCTQQPERMYEKMRARCNKFWQKYKEETRQEVSQLMSTLGQ